MTGRYARAAAIHADAFAGTGRGWSADEIRALADRAGGLIVDDADGFVLGQVLGDEAEVLTIAVRRDRQGRGAGRRLLAAFERAAAARGARRVCLDVSEVNRAARRLYGAAGYSEDGRRRRYYKDADGERRDAILMSRLIDSPNRT